MLGLIVFAIIISVIITPLVLGALIMKLGTSAYKDVRDNAGRSGRWSQTDEYRPWNDKGGVKR
jgi:hypothetical protein